MCALYNEIREKERRPTHDGRLFTHLIASMCVCVCVCDFVFGVVFRVRAKVLCCCCCCCCCCCLLLLLLLLLLLRAFGGDVMMCREKRTKREDKRGGQLTFSSTFQHVCLGFYMGVFFSPKKKSIFFWKNAREKILRYAIQKEHTPSHTKRL